MEKNLNAREYKTRQVGSFILCILAYVSVCVPLCPSYMCVDLVCDLSYHMNKNQLINNGINNGINNRMEREEDNGMIVTSGEDTYSN